MSELSEFLKAEGFWVDPTGRVFILRDSQKLRSGDEMQTHADRDGYRQVSLQTQYGRKSFKVHALVAEFHLPPRPSPLHEVRHLDGRRDNNAVSNLAWGTKSQNAFDRSAHRKRRTKSECANGHSLSQFGATSNGRCKECVRLINKLAHARRQDSAVRPSPSSQG